MIADQVGIGKLRRSADALHIAYNVHGCLQLEVRTTPEQMLLLVCYLLQS